MLYMGDFESTTDPKDCHVWAYGIIDIQNPDSFLYGLDVEQFITWCQNSKNATVYFHNLKFDGSFIIDYLLNNGYKHIINKKLKENKTFTSLISDQGKFYSLEIYFEVGNKKVRKVTILNSLNILNFKVSEIAKAFGLEETKGSIDYDKPRPKGYQPDSEELFYLQKDCVIVAKALQVLFSQGLTKMTQGSNALYDYKRTLENDFRDYFPVLPYDKFIRKSYKGGFVYADEFFKDKEIGKGLVFDVNSLYPFVMYDRLLPYGEGIYFEEEYIQDDIYPLYFQRINCQFEVKENHLPTIQIKKSIFFNATEYLKSSEGNIVELVLTNVDLKLFLEHYNVYNLEYIDGWKFRGTNLLFRNYIDKWIKVKIESEEQGNKGMRTLAKLMLNALYGKFALNPKVRGKIPFLDGNIVKYRASEEEERDPLYIPVGSFITSYAREITIRAAQKLHTPTEQYPQGRFLYADTDSLHIIGTEVPDFLDVHKSRLGAWKLELEFDRAKYIRAKCYVEEFTENEITELKVTIAGLSDIQHNIGKLEEVNEDGTYNFVTWENFKRGSRFIGKLKPEIVQGGTVLIPIDFTLN